ncbi:MAG: hypothetical protein ACOY0T_05525 [Myxococcota bacterium]
MKIKVSCFASLLPTILLLFAPTRAEAEARVAAAIAWQGECDDRAALQRETFARGVALEEPNPSSEVSWKLSVRVLPAESWEAVLSLSDAAGHAHERRVEARSCEELRAVVAWVLVVLARDGALPTQSEVTSSSAAFAPLADAEASPVAPSATSRPASEVPAAVEPILSTERTEKARAGSKRGSLGLGSHLSSGVGLLPSIAIGPTLYAEYVPRVSLAAIRLSLFHLQTWPYERSGVTLGVARQGARLGVRLRTGWAPLSIGAGIEAGRLLGAGSGTTLARAGRESALWFAAEAGPSLNAPLITNVLSMELGAALAYAPLSYSFEFGNGDEVSRSENVELRAFAGLSAKL